MPPKSPKPAPRLITPAEPHYRPSRLTVTYFALLAVPVVLWLLYALFRPAPEKVVPPSVEITAPAPTADTTAPPASTPPAPAETVPSAEERVAAAVAAAKQQAAPPVVPPSASVDPAAVLHYSESVTTEPDGQVQTAVDIDPLAHYPLAEHNWGDDLSPSRQIPAAGYTAYYLNLNTTKPQRKQIVARAHVNEIAVNYGWSDFHNIPSQQFAAYWVGKLRVPASTSGLYHIEGEIGQANVRVMLNRRIILDAKGNLDHQPFRLNTGEYLLEVEYKSRWHTTEFRLDIVPAPILSNSR